MNALELLIMIQFPIWIIFAYKYNSLYSLVIAFGLFVLFVCSAFGLLS